MSAKIHVKIKPDGNVDIWVEGVKGKKCLKLTEFLEEALGEIASKELTTDYYAVEVSEEDKLKENQ